MCLQVLYDLFMFSPVSFYDLVIDSLPEDALCLWSQYMPKKMELFWDSLQKVLEQTEDGWMLRSVPADEMLAIAHKSDS